MGIFKNFVKKKIKKIKKTIMNKNSLSSTCFLVFNDARLAQSSEV